MLKTMTVRTTIAAILATLTISAPAVADPARPINVPAGELVTALESLAKQADIELVFQADQLRGMHTDGVHGSYEPKQAVSLLLKGTDLTVRRDEATGIMLVAPPSAPKTASPEAPAAPAGKDTGAANESLGARRHIAQSDAAAAAPGAARAELPSGDGTQIDPTHRQAESGEVVVTGTRIRGGDTPSPVITIGSEQIKAAGFTDLGAVIRSIPQNFSGGQNPGVMGGGDIANQNFNGGSSLNLRGLGPDATLTLLNGRRMSYGFIRQAVDIAAIPLAAVERIEIVPDGASALYGSDAVGGVGNVILKRDFDGARLGARYGTAAQGGLSTKEYTATAGKAWSTGGLIATYQDESSDPIWASQRSYTESMNQPMTIYPRLGVKSGLLSVHQELGSLAELHLDGFRAERDNDYVQSYPPSSYRFAVNSKNSFVAPEIKFWLPGSWTLSVGGAWATENSISRTTTVNTISATSALTGDSAYKNRSDSLEVGAEGGLFSVPAGEVRTAIGLGRRVGKFTLYNSLSSVTSVDTSLESKYAYAEVTAPLVSAAMAVPAVRSLALTIAARSEDYDVFGAVTTPKFGFVYSPNQSVTIKASSGKSFKAPSLWQLGISRNSFLTLASAVGASGYPSGSTVLVENGGNPNLLAERAQTNSVTLAFHPEGMQRLNAELTGFDIDFTGRVLNPVTNLGQALSNPIYEDFVVRSPTLAEVEAVQAAGPFNNFAGVAYDPNNVVAIVSNRYTNVAKQSVSGVDLSGSYDFDLGVGMLKLQGAASWLHSSQRTTPRQSSFDLAGTMFNPAQLTSRVGAIWRQGGFSASLFANYTEGVFDPIAQDKGSSFTDFDTTVRYNTGADGAWWSGIELALSVQNLLDRDPPLYAVTSSYATPYDSTNYSAIGRFASLSLAKQW